MAPSFWQILIVLVLIVLLFGRGKISDLMGDVAKGIKSFRKGLKDDEHPDESKPAIKQDSQGSQGQTGPAADPVRKQETHST